MTVVGIVIPTYNESGTITQLLTELKRQIVSLGEVRLLVVIVDDSSPDGTSKMAFEHAEALKSANFQVKIIDRQIKDGYGKACIVGMEYLLSKKVDYIVQMDADMSHHPKYLYDLIKNAESHDLVIGSRYIKGASIPDWSLIRRLMSRYGNLYAKLILSNEVSDYTGGFNLYAADLIKKINLSSIKSSGYGFLIELKFKALLNAQNICEIPIVFNERQHGKSKMPRSTLLTNLILVPKLKIRSTRKTNSNKQV